MKLMKLSTRNKIMVIIAVLSLLAIAFFWGGNYGSQSKVSAPEPKLTVTKTDLATTNSHAEKESSRKLLQDKETTTVTGKQGGQPSAVAPKQIPKPAEQKQASITGTACTLSVVCTTILNNMDKFDADKLAVLPKDGVIFPATVVTFYQGESVFNVLQREMKKAGIHMEFTAVPVYHANYIEDIGNIYEFDCGELSGWVYKVNGIVPNYGCSRYQLRDGDKIEFVYTCNLGRDVGGYNFSKE